MPGKAQYLYNFAQDLSTISFSQLRINGSTRDAEGFNACIERPRAGLSAVHVST